MKKVTICLGVIALVMLVAGGVSAVTIPDGTDDIFHWQWDDNLDAYSWKKDTSDEPNIDIIQITEQASNGRLTLTLKVDGVIEESNDIWYWLWYNTTDAYYYLSYSNGSGDLVGLGTGTNYSQFMEGDVAVSDDTITGTIDLIGSGTVVKFWGWAAIGYSLSGGSHEYWQDWAPEAYSPASDNEDDNGGGEEEDGGSTPGFGFVMITSILVALALLERGRRRVKQA